MVTLCQIQNMQQTQWTNLIDPSTYYIGDSTDSTNPNLFINERKSNFSSGNIGLMYLSDYLYARGASANNWLFIQNGLNRTSANGNTASNQQAEMEYTMTRYGYNGNNRAWGVYNNGPVGNGYVNNTFAVRPVFYLRSDVKIAGKGTLENPYMIALN